MNKITFMTVKELAEVLGKNQQTIRRWAKKVGIVSNQGVEISFTREQVYKISTQMYDNLPSYVRNSIDESFKDLTTSTNDISTTSTNGEVNSEAGTSVNSEGMNGLLPVSILNKFIDIQKIQAENTRVLINKIVSPGKTTRTSNKSKQIAKSKTKQIAAPEEITNKIASDYRTVILNSISDYINKYNTIRGEAEEALKETILNAYNIIVEGEGEELIDNIIKTGYVDGMTAHFVNRTKLKYR